MQNENEHVMVLAAEFPDGSQEWICPTCGRHLIMRWPPNYSRALLEEGDPSAFHSGEVGGLNVEIEQTPSVESPAAPAAFSADLPLAGEPDPQDEHYLEPFRAWMENRQK